MASILHVVIELVLMSALLARSAEVAQCGENEIYTCGSVCTETCTYKPEICTMICKFGCFCKEGYVRETNETDSRCIKREECEPVGPESCGPNEIFATCGSMCPPTCDDWSYPLPKPPKICPKMCVQGCFCKDGLYRAKDGRCVQAEDCCGSREGFMECGTACPETCDHVPKFCTYQCVPGCFCNRDGYVRMNNSTNSPCIPRAECPH